MKRFQMAQADARNLQLSVLPAFFENSIDSVKGSGCYLATCFRADGNPFHPKALKTQSKEVDHVTFESV